MFDETAQTTEAFNIGLEAGKEEERKKYVNALRTMSEALADLEGKYWEANRQIALYDDEVKTIRTQIFDEIIKLCEGCYSRSFEMCKGYECIMHHCLACVDGDRWLKTMNANPGFQKWWEDKQDES